MRQALTQPPVPYTPWVEQLENNEASMAKRIAATMRRLQDMTYEDYGHSQRAVHAKSHGLIEARFDVVGALPGPYAQGLFAKAGSYPAIMRFSSIPGDVLDDDVVVPYGLAIKVIGADGVYLPDTKGARVQDFTLVNAPTFTASNLKDFSVVQAVLTATTDTGQFWKKGFSRAMRGLAHIADMFGAESGGLRAFGGPPPHPLGETYYSQTPYRYGDYIAKYRLVPASPELRALVDSPVHVDRRPNALREEVIDSFLRHGGVWEFQVQLRADAETMPVEDSTVEWPQEQSPFITVAHITATAQPAWSEERALQVDDGLSFKPWNALEAHRPLGSINRARRLAYPVSADFRAARNAYPMQAPEGRLRLSNASACPYGFAPGRDGRRPGTPDALPYTIGQPINRTAKAVLTSAAICGAVAFVAYRLRQRDRRSGRGDDDDGYGHRDHH